MENPVHAWKGLVKLMVRQKVQAALNPLFQDAGRAVRELELSSTDFEGFKLNLLAMLKDAAVELIDEQMARVEADPARSAKPPRF